MTKFGPDHYDSIYGSSQAYSCDAMETKYARVWANIPKLISNNKTIGEIGCGTGQLAKYLMYRGYNYLFGMDFSPMGILKARNLNPGYEDKFFVADIYKMISIPSDIVLCTEVLEHLENDKHIIDILQTGQEFIFTVPNYMGGSHVRCFKNHKQIRERYPELLIEDIEGYGNEWGNIVWLLWGTKL